MLNDLVSVPNTMASESVFCSEKRFVTINAHVFASMSEIASIRQSMRDARVKSTGIQKPVTCVSNVTYLFSKN